MTTTKPGAIDKGDLDLAVLFPSDFLKADDLRGRQFTVQITGISKEIVPMTGGRKESKLVLTLQGTPKKIILGKTNAFSIALLVCSSGAKLRECVGKRIMLTADVDRLKGQDVAAIRIASSPDALPGRAEAYAHAWRGERKGGLLIGRVKRALGLIAMGKPPPVESEAEEREEVEVREDVKAEPDLFASEPGGG